MNSWRFSPRVYSPSPEGQYYSDAGRIQREMSNVIPDFLPNFGATPPTSPPLSRFTFDKNAAYTVAINRTQEFLVKATIHTPTTFQANIFYFPGWVFYINGEAVQPTIDPNTGLMSTTIQPSTAEVVISGKLTETPLRKMADGLSLIGILVMVYLLI
jgi:hypothetical protein